MLDKSQELPKTYKFVCSAAYVQKQPFVGFFKKEILRNFFFTEHLWATAFAELYSERCQTSEMEIFGKIVNVELFVKCKVAFSNDLKEG